MKITIHAPFRMDSKGPLEGAVDYWAKKIAPYAVCQVEYAAKKSLSPDDVEAFYAKRLEGMAKGVIVALDERGRDHDSKSFAAWLGNLEDRGTTALHFCLGGAYGLPSSLARAGSLQVMRLSPLTFSHELALAVLLEQLYRARTLMRGHPYHHGEASALIQSKGYDEPLSPRGGFSR